jgi:hypothetical protein
LVLCAVSCAAPSPRPEPTVDCQAVDEQYDYSILHRFNAGAQISWFGVVDDTPGAVVGVDDPMTPTIDHNPVVEEIEDVPERGPQEPGRCGQTESGVFRARGFTDWGAFFADYSTATQNIPGSEIWEGVSFWARTPTNSDHSFFFLVDNVYTALLKSDDPSSPDNKCVDTTQDENGNDVYPEGTDPSETCGNSFSHIVTTDETWRYYTLPFSEFVQDRSRPNVRSEGLDPTVQFVRFTIRFPVETDIELWLDDLSLYRHWDR